MFLCLLTYLHFHYLRCILFEALEMYNKKVIHLYPLCCVHSYQNGNPTQKLKIGHDTSRPQEVTNQTQQGSQDIKDETPLINC